MLKIYFKSTCSTCRKALDILKEETSEHIEIVEYMKTRPSAQEIKEIVELIGIKPLDLVRKKEDLYKNEYKNKQISDQEWFEILSRFPELIERPIVVKDGRAMIGRPPETIKAWWTA
ncbi:MAG: arsenate reductase (glutaredoxin) [Bacteroidia bacterium]|nr:arsenate reductase (glutaredoxin) [Bacteroidia bacterium]